MVMVNIDEIVLSHGGHASREDGMCATEAVAYIAGEPHTDHPQCCSPVIASFMRAWNDGLPTDEDRSRLLKPYLTRVIGTVASDAVEQRRGWMALDWLIRTFTPAWLDLKELPSAKVLRDCAEIVDAGTLAVARPALEQAKQEAAAAGDAAGDAAMAAAWAAARAAAWAAAMAAARAAAWAAAMDAAWAAAGAAARAAAWAAAWAAAGDAAWDAAGAAARAAAWAAAMDAAGAAAMDAAGDAAGDGAWDRLAPNTNALQRSAQALLDRMIECR